MLRPLPRTRPSRPILKQAIPYYLKAQGLVVKATSIQDEGVRSPPGCIEAYQMYLQLAPNGAVCTNDVKDILAQSNQKPPTSGRPPRRSRQIGSNGYEGRRNSGALRI